MSEWDHGFWAEVDAQRAYRVACRECNWTHLVATNTAPPVRRCPWCGSQDIAAEVVGAFASFTCPVHGCVTWLTEESVWIDESKPLLDVVLCCPHCGAPGIPGQEQEEADALTPEDRIRANAEEVIRYYSAESGRVLAYDAESVKWADGYLEQERVKPDVGEHEEGLVTLFGSFLGECLIHQYGGHWSRGDDGWRVVIPSAGGGAKILSPFARVQRQLTEGAEASIARFFQVVPRMAGGAGQGGSA